WTTEVKWKAPGEDGEYPFSVTSSEPLVQSAAPGGEPGGGGGCFTEASACGAAIAITATSLVKAIPGGECLLALDFAALGLLSSACSAVDPSFNPKSADNWGPILLSGMQVAEACGAEALKGVAGKVLNVAGFLTNLYGMVSSCFKVEKNA